MRKVLKATQAGFPFRRKGSQTEETVPRGGELEWEHSSVWRIQVGEDVGAAASAGLTGDGGPAVHPAGLTCQQF